jgi:hypothetical protein
MAIPKKLASILAELTGIQKAVTDQFREKMLENSQKKARSLVFKLLDAQMRLDNPESDRGYGKCGDQLHIRHKNIDLVLTRYLRGDVLEACLDGISVATWADQSAPFHQLLGENDIEQCSIFSLEMIQPILNNAKISSLFMQKDVTEKLYATTSGLGMIVFKDQFDRLVAHRSKSLAIFPDLKRERLEADFGI